MWPLTGESHFAVRQLKGGGYVKTRSEYSCYGPTIGLSLSLEPIPLLPLVMNNQEGR